MRGGVRQRAVIMLAVNFNEARANRTQSLNGDGLIIHKRARAAIRHLHAPQNQFTLINDVLLLEQSPHRMISRNLENRRHLSLRLAVPHQRAITACPQGQRKRIKQNGFSRARLAGEHAEPVLEHEIEAVDQNNVTNRKLYEHRADPARL